MSIKISLERKKELVDFCKRLKLKFKKYELLELAFHHRSYSNENPAYKNINNERLEFLGDSVLGLAAAAFLYKDMKEHSEGELAKIKAEVVSEKALYPVGLQFGMDKMLVLGHGEELSGGRNKPAIIADCMEAVIGAYYLDSGYSAAEAYILSFLLPQIRKVQQTGGKDYKTLLQEFFQKKNKTLPIYKTVSVKGPDHNRVFSVTVNLGGVIYGPESGKSKKEAEQKAAKTAYSYLKSE